MSLIPITYFKNYNDAVFYSLGDSMNNKKQLPQMLVIIIYNSMGEFEELKVVDMDDEVLELNPEQKDIFI
jgi:hypothetical protein